MGKTAIIIGATGLTGGLLLEKLLQDNRYGKVKLFSRSSINIFNPKIEEHLIDLLKLKDHAELYTGDEVFCCVGTTKKKTPEENTYRKIDFGIPVSAATLAKENEIKTIAIVSALGANPDSSIFYSRTKGEMEEAVMDLMIPNTYLLQPALIMGERKEKRGLESLGQKVMKVADYLLIGPMKKYRSIHADTISTAMLYLANHKYSSGRIPSDEIKEIAAAAQSASS